MADDVINGILADPDFGKFSPQQRVDLMQQALAKHQTGFTVMYPSDQRQTTINLLKKRNAIPSDFTYQGKPLVPGMLEGMEQLGRSAAFMAGSTLGAGGGALTSPITGPVGPIAGSALGAGTATTAYDAGVAKFNEKMFGTPSDLSAKNLGEDFAVNAATDVAGRGVNAVLGTGLNALVGRNAVEAGANEAFAEQAQKNLGERADAFQSLNEAQEKTAPKIESKLIQGKEDVAKAREGAAHDVLQEEKAGLPEKRAQAVEAATGRTREATRATGMGQPEVAESGVELPSPELTARRTALADVAFSSSRKIGDEYGKQFDNILKPHLQTQVEPTTLPERVASIESWLKENSLEDEVDAPTSRLLRAIKKDFRAGPAAKEAEETEEAIQTTRGIPYRSPTPPPEEGAAPIGTKEKFPTVAEYRERRSQASALVANGKNAVSKSVANQLREGIEGQLEDAEIPGVGDLNKRYGTYKTLFDKKFYTSVAKAKDWTDAADTLFSSGELSNRIVGNANPEQQATLRQIYGDAANKDPKFVNFKEQEGVLKRLFPNTDLAKEDSIIHMRDDALKTGDYLAAQPQVAAKVETLAKQRALDEGNKAAANIVADIIPQLKTLPPDRQQSIMASIKGAKNPLEAATAAIDGFYGTTPEGMVQQLAAKQITPDEAAVGTIEQGKLGGGAGRGILERARQNWKLYGALALARMAMSGGIGGFWGAMAIAGGAAAGREGVMQLYLNSLRDPAVAQATWNAFKNPGAPVSQSVLARGLMDAALSGLFKKFTGIGQLEPAKPPPNVNDVATKPAVREGSDVRVGTPGESHAQIEQRMPPGKDKERGFVSADGKFMAREDARDAIKGMGGDPSSHGPHSDELVVNANLPPNPPTPITLGSSPMQQFATQALAKAVPPQKAGLFRDYDEAARAYRKGDVAALEPREWLRKGMTPQELADGWRRSRMGRVEAGLSMLPLDQVAQAWQLASDKNDKSDAAAAARVVKQKVADIGWGNVPQQAKAVIAPLIRRMLAPQEEEVNA